MSMNKYTTSDFEDAKFATCDDGRTAMRVTGGSENVVWVFQRFEDSVTVEYLNTGALLAQPGWPPAPQHPDQVPRLTLTEAELEEAVDASGSLKEFARRFGISIVPNPEPTAVELMLADLDGMNGDGFLLHNRHRAIVAEQLTALGWVKATSKEDDK